METMEQLVQCPVCTLYLHEGMSLSAHLDTHPKDQVIHALCSLAKSGKSGWQFGSRCSTPYDCSGQSERSYRSRSRTPAHRYRHHHSRTPSDPYRPPSKSLDSTEASTSTSKSDSFQNARLSLDPGRVVTTPLQSDSGYVDKSDPMNANTSMISDQLYFIPQNGAQRDFSSRNMDRHNEFVFTKQPMNSDPITLTTFVQPKLNAPSSCAYSSKPGSSREMEERKDAGGMKGNVTPTLQYMNSPSKPVHFVLPVTQSFVQSGHKNIVISTALPGVGQNHSKNILRPMFTSQFNSISSPSTPHGSSTPTSNPQIIYKELMQEVSGKKFISAIPFVNKGLEEIPPQSPVMYQNLMVFNPYNTLYPQQALPTDVHNLARCYSDTSIDTSLSTCNKAPSSRISDHGGDQLDSNHSSLLSKQHSQTAGLEMSSSLEELPNESEGILDSEKSHMDEEIISESEIILDQGDSTNDNSSKSDRVKILSNVKVELPIQHIPDIIDLTSSSDNQQKKISSDIAEPNLNEEEALLPDFVDAELCHSYSQNRFCPRSNFSLPNNLLNSSSCNEQTHQTTPEDVTAKQSGAIVNTFSVIKNIGNPNVYRDNSQQNDENKSTCDDICAIPDLTCNEKPSISPCSDLTNDSNEGVYDRLCTLSDTASTSAKLPPILQNRYPLPATVTRVTARKNLFVKKTKKILSIKSSKNNCNSSEKPSSSKHFSVDISKTTDIEGGSQNSQRSLESDMPEETGRLDGFFKELDKQKKCSEITNTLVTSEKSASQIECRSLDVSVEDDSRSCDVDIKEQSMDIETECTVRTYNNDFRNCISEKTDSLKVISDDCTSGVETLMDNLSQKNFTQLETMRPVNVIAFGSILTSNPTSENTTNTFVDVDKSNMEYTTSRKEKQELDNLIGESYLQENVYTEYFSTHKVTYNGETVEEHSESNSEQKVEVCIIDEEDMEKKEEYITWETPQKEEYGFSNFLDCSYGQGIYQKVEDTKDAKSLEERSGDQRSQFSSADACGGEHNDYAELICPRNSYLEHDHKGSFLDAMGSGEACGEAGGVGEVDALNIRTDERMPPRGELSEQESSGDTPWPGMYCDVVGGSTSYDLLARETWPSDGSDMEMPVSPAKDTYNEVEDIPIVVGVKPPDRNYRCATCGKCFNCPKERRVHRSKEHPPTASGAPGPPKKIIKRRRTPLPKGNLKIKNEKFVKTEPPLTGTKVEELLNDADVDLIPVKMGDEELEEKKPKIELVRHETKKKKKDYLCGTCKLEFTTEPAFNYHLKIHPLECLTCGKYFHKRANLQLHVKRHLGIKNYRCDICEKRFVTKQKLVEHYNVHTGITPIKCNLCEETFRRHSNMVQHRNRHHFHMKKRLRDYVCHCGEVFHSKKKLAWHKEIHDERPKACLHCSEKFIHVASLTRHMRRAHNSYYIPDANRQKENVTCPICDHVYLKSSIDMHLRTHTGSKPYSCVICNKNFTTKWNLKLHRWTHANRSSKPFKCTLCKGAFVRHTDYVSHMNSHKSVRPYTCNYCGCQFIRKYNCQRHVKEHENDKKYVCEVPDCGKTFHRSYYLSEHMSVHSGLRPFSCNICGKTSSTKSNHNKHIKIHHAREPVTTEG